MQLGFNLEADEIIPNLWQGSFPRLLSAIEAGFDMVVLCAEERLKGRPPNEYTQNGLYVVEAPFLDTGYPTDEELKIAHWAADKVIRAVKAGKKVLVTCQAGLNRSGLVNAIAIRTLRGITGGEAVMVVKGRRDMALCNTSFATYVYNLK